MIEWLLQMPEHEQGADLASLIAFVRHQSWAAGADDLDDLGLSCGTLWQYDQACRNKSTVAAPDMFAVVFLRLIVGELCRSWR
jgi:hypothetical protein